MKKIVLAALAATLMLSSGAWAGFSIHVDNNKKSERRNDPPPPPPPPRERLECRFEKRIAARVTATTAWITATAARWLKVVATAAMPKAVSTTTATTVPAG